MLPMFVERFANVLSIFFVQQHISLLRANRLKLDLKTADKSKFETFLGGCWILYMHWSLMH